MRLLTTLLDLLYPPRCAFCHRLVRSGEETVCKDCLAHLPYTGDLAEHPRISHLDKCVSPLFYEKLVRDSLHRFKFDQRTGYAGIYAGFMVKCIDENHISCDSITWVPLSRQRLRKRGYDQARLLAVATAKNLALPCVPMLRKIRNNPAQSGTGNAEKRKQNVKNVYAALPDAPIRGKRVLLVDDIVTTGATLGACAEVLRKSGADSVCAATLARRKD